VSISSSPRFLRNVLLADAASGLASGVLQLAFTAALAQWLNLPHQLLLGTGWFLLAYAAFAAHAGTRVPVRRPAVWLLVIGNFTWAAACVALLLGDLLQPSAWGVAYVVVQAIFVTVMAELQWFGLRNAPMSGLAAA
jgi:hypothetical protein